jgi:hypothetical protein
MLRKGKVPNLDELSKGQPGSDEEIKDDSSDADQSKQIGSENSNLKSRVPSGTEF